MSNIQLQVEERGKSNMAAELILQSSSSSSSHIINTPPSSLRLYCLTREVRRRTDVEVRLTEVRIACALGFLRATNQLERSGGRAGGDTATLTATSRPSVRNALNFKENFPLFRGQSRLASDQISFHFLPPTDNTGEKRGKEKTLEFQHKLYQSCTNSCPLSVRG